MKADNRGYIQRIGSAIVPKNAFATVGAIGGAIGGGMMGAPAGPVGVVASGFKGAAVGAGLGNRIAKAVGFGDYVIENNSLLTSDVPEMRNTSAGMIVRHREYIGDIAPSVNFASQTHAINPGISSSFPWLAQIASAFEEYKLRGMIYEFKTMSSDNVLSAGASTALGSVIMATQYNAISPPFQDKKQMENYQFANSCKPSESMMHAIECKHSLTAIDHHYVRTSPNVSNLVGDRRLYDIGNFQIATIGMQNTTGIIGELWVTYEIEFLKPKYFNYALEDHYWLSGITNSALLGTTSGATTITNGQTNAIGGVLSGNGQSYSFPQTVSSGTFMVQYSVTGSSGAALGDPTVTLVNAVQVLSARLKSQFIVSNAGSTHTTYVMQFTIKLTGSGAAFTLTGGGIPATSLVGDLYVTGLSDSVM